MKKRKKRRKAGIMKTLRKEMGKKMTKGWDNEVMVREPVNKT